MHLGCTFFGGIEDRIFHVAGLQPFPQDLAVHCDVVEEPAMADLGEVAPDSPDAGEKKRGKSETLRSRPGFFRLI